jgi:hypothetical protein
MFRKELPDFGEPAPGFWDGWARINSATQSGGIIGIFRCNAVENERIVTIPYLLPKKTYILTQGYQKKPIIRATVKQLAEKGFKN